MKTQSRTADKFVVRMPDGMRQQISEEAVTNYQSMNNWIVQAVEEKLVRAQRLELLLDTLEAAAKVHAADKVTKRVEDPHDGR